MRFSSFAATAALAGSAIAVDHLVVVGNGSLTFEPANLTAAEGDTVTFKFWPKSHSVAQAAFAKPCEPMENGFWSGFIPSEKGAAATTFMIEIKNASQPLWYYCSRGNHCQEGMVGVINPPASGQKTLAAFAKAAANATNSTSPTSATAVGGMLMNGTSMDGSGTNGTNSPGAASMLSASKGAIFTVAVGMVASLLL
ncbi:Cupredoxin [Bimuria novae-zelandiae CBS 107.79]|uniref:Cupredoxin n=1 Tax=Bimuria novae-zelandiae CBS 107.79 TaxID=1447943 RepID=A0A6A5UHF0_9PLEO|nr:Cupredoxin [Bimuria novae-zelandiae CBS 107.79]